MDQETANRLFHEYGCLLLLNFPSEYNFNIDNQIWVTNEKFKGLKLIPPGPHYIHFSEKGQEYGEKFGFFIYFKKSLIVVKRWNAEFNCFESLQESEEVAYAEGVRTYQFDQNLGAYSQKDFKYWNCLSNFISSEVIERLEPLAKANNLSKEIISTVMEQRIAEEEIKEQDQALENESQINGPKQLKGDFYENLVQNLEKELKVQDEKTEKAMKNIMKYKEAYGNVYFTDIPSRKLIHGYSKDQLTNANFDKSTILKEICERSFQNSENKEQKFKFDEYFLGELQFAFILFLFGQNYEGFEQWKKIIILLCHCESAIYTNRDLFSNFVPVVYEQLDQLPPDFLDDETAGGIYFEPSNIKSKAGSIKENFIYESLNSFYEICMVETSGDKHVSKKIKSRAEKLRKMMKDKFNIDISHEDLGDMIFICEQTGN